MSKIEFKLSEEVIVKLSTVLKKYGGKEVGGVLVGTKIGKNKFKIVDVSISNEFCKFRFFTQFIRGTRKSTKLLKKHFKNGSGHYIGEWHSHPMFSLSPSIKDISTMWGIVQNEGYGVMFVTLLIVKLVGGDLTYKGYFFHKDSKKFTVLDN